LPPIHASLNALTAVVLIFAFRFIKQKKVEQHRKAIYLAFALSVGFLLSYVLYHFTTPETLYGGEGFMRTLYFILLISHIVLAAGIFPFILFTFIRAYTNQIDQHKKMARWVFPFWLYVAITGPICYLMLLPYY
jgi:putative membrane protein